MQALRGWNSQAGTLDASAVDLKFYHCSRKYGQELQIEEPHSTTRPRPPARAWHWATKDTGRSGSVSFRDSQKH